MNNAARLGLDMHKDTIAVLLRPGETGGVKKEELHPDSHPMSAASLQLASASWIRSRLITGVSSPGPHEMPVSHAYVCVPR